jgi:hypothetical protein
MREAEDSGVSRCEGLGTAGWGNRGGSRTVMRELSGRTTVVFGESALHHGVCP